MFNFFNSGDPKKESLESWESMDDKTLLGEYQLCQEFTDADIKNREKIFNPEDMQNLVEANFAKLNQIKTEMERRGLQAPTLEERQATGENLNPFRDSGEEE